MLENNRYIEKFVNLFTSESDKTIEQNLSMLINELTKEASGADQVLRLMPDLDLILKKMLDNELEIKNYCLSIICNLLKNADGTIILVKSKVSCRCKINCA